MTRVCPQCGNATSEAVCGIDRWSTVPIALSTDSGLTADRLLLGRYRVGALLKADGSIKVYGGLDERMSRPVRINLLPIPPGTPLAVIARMQRAAKALENIHHPSLVQVLASAHSERGDLAIITDHLAGPTLAERLRAGPIDPPRTAAMGYALFSALEVAHAAGVAHHDLTPERIVMPADNEVVIERTGVFDLLRMARVESDDTVFMPPGLAYSAPEMAREKDASRQADIYSVGAILYEALTGRPVFDEPTAADLLVAHLQRTPAPPSVGGNRLEGPLVELITHCLVKKPANRPEGAVAARFASEGAHRGPLAWTVTPNEAQLPEHAPDPFLREVKSSALGPPGVPPPLITRDSSRPRFDPKTEPQLAPAPPPRSRYGALWPWVAVAALLIFIVWSAVKPPQATDIGGQGLPRAETVAYERPIEVAARKKGQSSQDAVLRAHAEAETRAHAEADARVKTEADARAKTEADARVKAEADARVTAEAAARAKAADALKVVKPQPTRTEPRPKPAPSTVTRDRHETPPAAAFRRAAVLSTPPGATVSIEGSVVGQTPTVLVWPPGERGYAIIALDGYQSRGLVFDDRTNGKTLLFELVPKQ